MKDQGSIKLLAIGGSAGSLSMVLKLLPQFKITSRIAVVLIFHRKATDDTTLVDVLAHRTDFTVKEIEDKDEIVPNMIYVVPAEYHALIEKDHTFTLDDSEKVNFSRPSIDVTFESAADVYGESLACMLLSGANEDGVNGLREAQRKGGFIIIQDPKTAEVSFMPQMAMDTLKPDFVMTEINVEEMFGLLRDRKSF
ncbi:MAG: chemotaxis protein CheB [Cyclobacteriaceae bacterium]|nr:chemotaxis protein CheB [Cyclobacteriaceae bacterium]